MDKAGTSPSPANKPANSLKPRSIFVPDEDPRADARELVDTLLSDGFMGFLSLLLLPLILIPFFVTLSPSLNNLFNILDATIILFFIIEYAAKIFLAESRWDYFRNPWHLLDLTVIGLSFVSYLPILALQRSGSAVLLVRLLRLPRAFAVTTRTAGSRLNVKVKASVAEGPPPEIVIQQTDPTHPGTPRSLTWAELEQHLSTSEEEWIDLSNMDAPGIRRLSALLKVHERLFKFHEVDDLYPQVSRTRNLLVLFVHSGAIRYPVSSKEPLTISRKGLVVFVARSKIVTVSPHGLDMVAKLEETSSKAPVEHSSFAVRTLYGIFGTVVQEYRNIFAEIEVEVARISATPKSQLPGDFLQRMYHFNKATRRLTSYMVHLKEILTRFATGRFELDGNAEETHALFESLVDEMGFLGDIAEDAADSLQSVTDVYINQSSFETNRILKILALITALTVLPATLGSVLGIDGPYSFSFFDVVAITVIGMSFIAYTFAKLGWLKV